MILILFAVPEGKIIISLLSKLISYKLSIFLISKALKLFLRSATEPETSRRIKSELLVHTDGLNISYSTSGNISDTFDESTILLQFLFICILFNRRLTVLL